MDPPNEDEYEKFLRDYGVRFQVPSMFTFSFISSRLRVYLVSAALCDAGPRDHRRQVQLPEGRTGDLQAQEGAAQPQRHAAPHKPE